jgi:aminodeoxyfutalosine deaminase
MRRLRDEQIPLEVCITSNVRTGAVASLVSHPVRRLFDAGAPITLNTDDPALFDCDLAGEFALAKEVFGFSESELEGMRKNARTFAFGR